MDLTKFGFTGPTSSKKQKTEAEKKENKKKYESKRSRKFQQLWLSEFPGLGQSETENVMFCTTCRENDKYADKSSTLFVGTSAFRKDTLTSHWKSLCHIKCQEREALKAKASQSDSQPNKSDSGVVFEGPIVDCVRKMDKDIDSKIQKLINTAFFVCKEEMPFTSYTSLITLQCKNEIDLGNFYRSDNACRRFVKFIYEELYDQSLKDLSEKKFFSILIDGATDTSVTENELIYVRFLDEGKPVNHYLSVEDIQNANATGILQTIETAFERSNVDNWKDKLVGFGSDGASVNLGVRGGVAALLKTDVNHLISVHCVAHRLELAANNAIKEHSIMKDTQDLLQHIYKHYHYSPKALRELRNIAEALEEKVLKPSNLHGTRWLPHIQGALTVLTKNFTAIMTHFDHIRGAREGNAEVQGRATNISKKLSEYPFLYMVFFMLDVLKVLGKLSLQMQKDDLTLSELFDAITSTCLSLVELKHENGEELTQFISDVQNNTYKRISLKNVQQGVDFSNKRTQIIDAIVGALDKRFGPMEKDPILKAAVLLLDFAEYPINRHDLANFANEELTLLVQHFQAILINAGCDMQLVRGEFRDFKSHVFNHRKVPIEHYFIVNRLLNLFPNFLQLIEIILVLPLSSAACERGFSAMKRIKSDWRSCLAPDMLRMLMFIAIEGPTVEGFNPVPVAYRWWRSGRAKRPGFNPYDFRNMSDDETDDDHND